MWKWAIKFDRAFEIPTYRVKADGLIVGTIRKFGIEWSWEVTFPGQTMPEFCRGTRLTKDECQEAIKDTFQALTKGMTRDKAIGMIVSGTYVRLTNRGWSFVVSHKRRGASRQKELFRQVADMPKHNAPLWIPLAILYIIGVGGFRAPNFVPAVAEIAKNGVNEQWLGFVGNLIAAAVTLGAAIIAWLAVQRQIMAQNKIAERRDGWW